MTADLREIKLVIAIAGEKASGKGAVAGIIRDRFGAFVMRFSDPIRVAAIVEAEEERIETPGDLVERTFRFYESELGDASQRADGFDAALYERRGVRPPGAGELQEMGNALRSRFGAGVLSEVLAGVAERLQRDIIVVDGVRNPGEIEALESRFREKFILLGVTAPFDVRSRRFLNARRRIGDPLSEEEFIAIDARDNGEGQTPDGLRVASCLTMVAPEYVIQNDGTYEDLSARIMRCLSGL